MTSTFVFFKWLMRPPVRLSATAVRLADSGPGEISAVLSFDDGRHATIMASGLMPGGFPFSVGFRALFERAALELHTVLGDGPPQSRFTVFDGDAHAQTIPVSNKNPYQVELQRFVDCIRGRVDPRLLDAERVVEALIISTATLSDLTEA